MAESVANALVPGEDKRLDRLPESAKTAVKKLAYPSMDDAKASVGEAIRCAIGEEPLRVYGSEGQMSRVISGESIPDYMGRIASNPEARRRYALSLLRGDKQVKVRTVIEIEEAS
jgi:hypothetical protein